MSRPPHTLPYRPGTPDAPQGDMFAPPLKHPTQVGSYTASGKVAPTFFLHVNGEKVRDAKGRMRKFHSRESADAAAAAHDAQRVRRIQSKGIVR